MYELLSMLGTLLLTTKKKTSNFIYARIGAAYQKWNELKHVLTDRRIKLLTGVRFLTTCVRSRLLFSIQACSLTEKELDTVEVICNGFLRKMVKGGYQCINAPTNKEKQTTTDKEVD